jgi:hypothetical protein
MKVIFAFLALFISACSHYPPKSEYFFSPLGVTWKDGFTGKVTSIGLVQDPKAFRILIGGDGYYAVDDRFVYYRGRAIFTRGKETAELLTKADPETFVVIDHNSAYDSTYFYWRGVITSVCDKTTFRHLVFSWYSDSRCVYYGVEQLPNANSKAFIPVTEFYGKDNAHVYYTNEIIQQADAYTFGQRGVCIVCGEDKNRCYWSSYPVPCDGKPHSQDEFARPMITLPPGMALLATSSPISIDREVPNPSLRGNLAGYWRSIPGRHTMNLRCWNKDHDEQIKFVLDVELGKFYRLKRRQGTPCEIEVERRHALVIGKAYDPEIQFRWGQEEELSSQKELDPGTNKLTAVCRDVMRSGMREGSIEFSLDLEAGKIYLLDALFIQPENKCDVRATSPRRSE